MSSSEKNIRKAIGGVARAAALSPERRKEIARAAAERRWGSADRVSAKPYVKKSVRLALSRTLSVTTQTLDDGVSFAGLTLFDGTRCLQTFAGDEPSAEGRLQAYVAALTDLGVHVDVERIPRQAQLKPSDSTLATIRKKFLDFDARPEPKTDRWCVKCQRDLQPGRKVRIVRVMDAQILHPADAGDAGEDYLVGLDCAELLGLEWSRPDNSGT